VVSLVGGGGGGAPVVPGTDLTGVFVLLVLIVSQLDAPPPPSVVETTGIAPVAIVSIVASADDGLAAFFLALALL
jgi:hypothetical protein